MNCLMALLVVISLFSFFAFVLGLFREDDGSEPESKTEPSYENRCIYDYTDQCWGHALSSWSKNPEGHYEVLGHGPAFSPIEGEDPHQGFIETGKELTRMGGSFSINMPKHLKEGDLLRIRNKSKAVIDWEVLEVSYRRNPKDMFSAVLRPFSLVEDPNGVYDDDLENG